MNDFKNILKRLKMTIQSTKKVTDKEVAKALQIKPNTFATYKRRDKPPYKAIFKYCHDNRLDVTKVLYSSTPVIEFPRNSKTDHMLIKYFRSLDRYKEHL